MDVALAQVLVGFAEAGFAESEGFAESADVAGVPADVRDVVDVPANALDVERAGVAVHAAAQDNHDEI